MKNLVLLFVCAALVQILTVHNASAHTRLHGPGGVTFAVFYDGLSPHGEWIAVGGGIYGWRPFGVTVGWRPYTVGRWCWTRDGWYWVSDEPWGWAAYHYGRWYYDDFYGWIWIPGYDWAPAWVEWRYGGDYIGWAPLGPYAVFSIHWGIHYRTHWYTPVHWWSFVHCSYIATPQVHRHVYRSEQNPRYIGVTRTGGSVRHSGGRIVSRGPEPEYVERRGNIRLAPVAVRDVESAQVDRLVRDGAREHIEVYRPRIEERADDASENARPARVREESGRSIELDTRKIDLRAREATRTDGRDVRRGEEFQTRDESVRRGSDEGMRNRDNRGRGGDTWERPDVRNEERRKPERSGEGDYRLPERQQAPQRDGRERKREESYQRPDRDHVRPAVPERREERPRNDAAPRRSPDRDDGGRGGRGR